MEALAERGHTRVPLNKLNNPIYRLADRLVTGVRADEFFRIAILFTVVIWVVWAINMSSPGRLDRSGQLKGADFLQFYVMGHLATEQAPDVLYDPAAYAAATRRLVPESVEFFPPVYPPQVSVLFQPLAALPYGWAVAVWWFVCIVLYGGRALSYGKPAVAYNLMDDSWVSSRSGHRRSSICSAPGFLDSGLKVITSTRPRPARRNRVALGLDSDSRTSPASTVRCTFA